MVGWCGITGQHYTFGRSVADERCVLRSAHILQLMVIALLGVAVVMVASAGMTVGDEGAVGSGQWSVMHVLGGRHVIYAALAVGAMLAASRINVRQTMRVRGWTNPLAWVLAASLILMAMTLVPGLGRSVNGASRWLYLGPRRWGLSFQPSELVKWVLVLCVAWWCSRRRGVMHRFGHGLVPPLLLVAVAAGLVLVEDLGTGLLIAAVAGCLLVAGGARVWHLAMMVPVGLAAAAAAVLPSPYRLARLTAFWNPWADPQGSGYHPIQSMVAIAQGGLSGRGLGNGVQKFGYLPEDTTDFIFAVICEELGIVGAALVVGLYLILLWVGLSIVRDCKDMFGRLVGLGVLLTIALQALMNLAVVTVVVPTKGIALPLLSAGGTGWIVTAAAVGLVAALDNANRLEAEQAGCVVAQRVLPAARKVDGTRQKATGRRKKATGTRKKATGKRR